LCVGVSLSFGTMTAAENLAKIRKGKSVISSAKTFSDMQFRRDKAYAHVEGHAAAGRLPLHIKLAYTAPTMSTLPIVVLLAVYMNVFYEKLGASLTYIRCVLVLVSFLFFFFFFFFFFLLLFLSTVFCEAVCVVKDGGR